MMKGKSALRYTINPLPFWDYGCSSLWIVPIYWVNAVEVRASVMSVVLLLKTVSGVQCSKRALCCERWCRKLDRNVNASIVWSCRKDANADGNVGLCRVNVPTCFYYIGHVLKKGQAKSTINKWACMKRLMRAEEATEVCSWSQAISVLYT